METDEKSVVLEGWVSVGGKFLQSGGVWAGDVRMEGDFLNKEFPDSSTGSRHKSC